MHFGGVKGKAMPVNLPDTLTCQTIKSGSLSSFSVHGGLCQSEAEESSAENVVCGKMCRMLQRERLAILDASIYSSWEKQKGGKTNNMLEWKGRVGGKKEKKE